MRQLPLVVLGILAALALGAALLVGSGILGGRGGVEETYLAVRDLDHFLVPEIRHVGVGTEVEWRDSGLRDRRAGPAASRTT